MSVHTKDETVTLHHGDALEVARTLDDGSANCIVTSPPYFGLRDYGEEGQYGRETSPSAYVETMRSLFSELRRVLADDGTLWLNLGDSYVAKPASGRGQSSQFPSRSVAGTQQSGGQSGGLPNKNLIGIPWRVAFALQDDGWILRNDIIWSKPNGMPESIIDRLTSKHEYVFMLSKSQRYWFDLDAIRVPHSPVSVARAQRNRFTADRSQEGVGSPNTMDPQQAVHEGGRNPGDVWSIPTQPFPEAHFAAMPLALAENCVRSGCRPGGTVLDPFSGSGTSGLAAALHGRKYVGIDLNRVYLDLSIKTRLSEPTMPFSVPS